MGLKHQLIEMVLSEVAGVYGTAAQQKQRSAQIHGVPTTASAYFAQVAAQQKATQAAATTQSKPTAPKKKTANQIAAEVHKEHPIASKASDSIFTRGTGIDSFAKFLLKRHTAAKMANNP